MKCGEELTFEGGFAGTGVIPVRVPTTLTSLVCDPAERVLTRRPDHAGRGTPSGAAATNGRDLTRVPRSQPRVPQTRSPAAARNDRRCHSE